MVTIGERIILHLSQYSRFREQYECPVETTQNGISEAIEISRAHVAIELKRLKSNDELEERTAHVEGAKSKRKVYFLALKGEERAREMRNFAKEKKVRLIEQGKEKELVSGSIVLERLKKRGLAESKALELVLQLDEIEPSAHEPKVKEEGKPRFLPPAVFVGREWELERLRTWKNGKADFFAVIGMTGIGKTSLAEKFSSEMDSDIFWHKVYESDNSTSLLNSLGTFLRSVGKRRLGSYMSSAITPDFKEVGAILRKDLNDVLLVLDDCNRCKYIEDFLSFLKENRVGAKVMVTSNKKPGFYNRSDVVVGKTVEEMFLGGLDGKASRELLKVKDIAPSPHDFKRLYELTKGHPVALMMMASKDHETSYNDYLRYLNEELLGDLRTDEENMLRRLSVFRGSFSHDFIKESEKICLHRLMRKSLVQDRGDEYMVPDLVNDYFYNHLEKTEKKENHSTAADHYLREGNALERLYHLVRSGREFEAVTLALREKDELMASPGEFYELIRGLRPQDRYAPNFSLLKKNVSKRLRKT
ncbi:MAG: hypothetical protein KAI64_05255 [Thermoplasmata archaeon]|nr:hypothetical protein [Thermoplasmata archaeon]